MNNCKKCGNEIRENSKFCANCGAPIKSSNIDKVFNNNGAEEEDKYKNNMNANSLAKSNQPNSCTSNKSKTNNLKIIIPLIVMILVIIITGVLAFIKINASEKENMKKSIEISKVDIDNYPNIEISIKVSNYEKSLNVKNFTLKENDAFQKDLKLSDKLEENEYIISYKTTDESAQSERNIKVACLDGDKEEVVEYSYESPEETKNSILVSNSNNVVDTYDHNEIDVKQALENYEKAYIRMINSKDIYYIKSSVDLSGGLINEFTNTIKSYTEQQITEDLIEHKIEEIKKINDSQYEVTVYEKFYISYGKEKKNSYVDYRTTYILNKTNHVFKVYAIKNIITLGNKTNN